MRSTDVMETIRPKRDDAPLQTRRAEGTDSGVPAAMIRFAVLALVLLVAGLLFVLVQG